MTVRSCARCRKPYGETAEGAAGAAAYAPFCSKRCADLDLGHWLRGDYVIGDAGELSLSGDDAGEEGRPRPADDEV